VWICSSNWTPRGVRCICWFLDETFTRHLVTVDLFTSQSPDMVVLLLDIKRVSTGMGGAPGGLDFVRNASTILGFNIFLQTPERLDKYHDEVVALAPAKKNRAFVDKTFSAAEVAEATRHLESRKGAGKVVLTF
jgi:NADPH:quinone reductase-like Zn-dependent oxidoreductase